ncbi:MAG: double zinc ribbon domain-containing protein [Pikeienuella sp.]
MKSWLSTAAEHLTQFIYPPTCPGCRAELADGHGLCPDCWKEVSFIAGDACDKCGAPTMTDVAAGGDYRGEILICDACAHTPGAWSKGRAAVVYDGVGRSLTLNLKHGDRLDIAPLAATWLARTLGPLTDQADLIAPTPLHWTRLAQRRFNQAGELARSLAIQINRHDALALDLLTRTRRTPSQGGRNRQDRYANVAGAFAVTRSQQKRIVGQRVLLVDDVMTTGATLSACAEACRTAGAADVNVIVLARVARDDWPD